MADRILHDGQPLLIAITLSPRQHIGFSVSNDEIIRQRPDEVLEQLELLCQRLRRCEYSIWFFEGAREWLTNSNQRIKHRGYCPRQR